MREIRYKLTLFRMIIKGGWTVVTHYSDSRSKWHLKDGMVCMGCWKADLLWIILGIFLKIFWNVIAPLSLYIKNKMWIHTSPYTYFYKKWLKMEQICWKMYFWRYKYFKKRKLFKKPNRTYKLTFEIYNVTWKKKYFLPIFHNIFFTFLKKIGI
jgi:hypothetical protein